MRVVLPTLAVTMLLNPAAARADEFCEAAVTDCRARLLAYINRESVRLDVGTEEITDSKIADAIIARFRARVPVRLIVEPRRTSVQPANGVMLTKLKAAGLPMRYKKVGDIVHWKMMIFAGQHTVEFGAAQLTQSYLVPIQPLVNFTQDPIVFSTDASIVNSFERKFDDAWVDTTNFGSWGNAAAPVRAYSFFSIDPDMNFVPAQNFGARSKPLYDSETGGIDVIMYKITEATHAEAMIRAVRRGIRVRLIVEPARYRLPDNVWQAYYLDKMYAAGVSIRDRAHLGFLHQKTTLLYSHHVAVFGSSNWTTASNGTQYEHNDFSTDPAFFEWFRKLFVRKWSSSTETKAFVPLPPDKPVYVGPANTSIEQPTTVVLSWKPGLWAHRADVYLGTSSPPTLWMKDVTVSPNSTKKVTATGLQPGRSYFWKIVSKTMAGKTASGPVWSFGT